ncbi:NAD-dependent epimerase/dehydratase family protein [Mucilaginibacter aquaedulcis]|uniref:NAD-dependent epimerase/dehydratase family protein n=1 Tax=Mucilaginibacter aquaedulcis TaxID=1187081 RepID=UPI0025B2BD92|nr:NAD-dependent epimerase/dehydratase family protein [Mucilaginibacter aquaedulcis]MDN3547633.1 NAD-dependent epimerase/dehydratase family protein [Mucilaginibacter aquaedulcis]
MILLTGSSGFLGKAILAEMGTLQVKTLSRTYGDYQVNLQSEVPHFKEQFELVIHAAGKAHSVPRTEREKQDFFDVNVAGTANLLKGLENSGLPKSFIFISSVSVYGKEAGIQINENTSLLATDAYGKSKIAAETLVQDWCDQNKVICTILRLPLLAGPNPPGNLKSMIKGIGSGYYFNIAGGKAKKSIVLADDVAKILPAVAKVGGVFNLTDRYHPNFSELSKLIAGQLDKSTPLNIPLWLAKLMAYAGNVIGSKSPIDIKKLNKMISELTFNDDKAVATLGWNPRPVLQSFKIKS